MTVTFKHSNDDVPLDEFRRKNRFKQVKFSIYLLAAQMGLLCLFISCFNYSVKADASILENGISVAHGGGAGRTEVGQMQKILTFQTILAALFLGASFAVMPVGRIWPGRRKLYLIVIALGFQWSLLCRGFFYFTLKDYDRLRIEGHWITLDVHDMTEALMTAFSLVLSSSFVTGRIAPVNLLLLVFLFVPFYHGCKFLNEEIVLARDPGCVLPVHLFGPVFGWTVHAVALVRRQSRIDDGAADDVHDRMKNDDTAHKTLGSLFIFLTLPVLNGILSESDAEMTRCIVNTCIAAMGAYVASFGVTNCLAHTRGRVLPVSWDRSPLIAGAIAVGPVSTLMLQPYGALTLGLLTGASSVAFALFCEPWLRRRLGLPMSDLSYDILSTHAIPSLVGGLAAVPMAAMSENVNGWINYHHSLYPIYPARVPSNCSTETCTAIVEEIIGNYPYLLTRSMSRTAAEQAGFQAIGLATTLTWASIGGFLCGIAMVISANRCGNAYPRSVWSGVGDEAGILSFSRRKWPSRDQQQQRHLERREDVGSDQDELSRPLQGRHEESL